MLTTGDGKILETLRLGDSMPVAETMMYFFAILTIMLFYFTKTLFYLPRYISQLSLPPYTPRFVMLTRFAMLGVECEGSEWSHPHCVYQICE